MNRFIGIGRITKELELKETQSGTKYLQFDIAINNGKDKDGNEREATFVNLVAWENRAETIAKFFKKGHRIAIEGSLKVDKYQNEQGENRYKTYVLVQGFEFLESKPKDNFTPSEPEYTQTPKQEENPSDPFAAFGESEEIPDSELPF